MKNIEYLNNILFALCVAVLTLACEEEDQFTGTPLPVSDFIFESNAEDYTTIHFVSKSFNAATYLWDFGDGSTSDEMSPTHTYATVGDFQVSLSVTGGDLMDAITKPITIVRPGGIPTGVPVLAGVEMDEEEAWTVGHNSGSDPLMSYEFGSSSLKLTANESADQIHLWQAVDLEAGKRYLVAMDVAGPSLTNGYFQITIGRSEPVSSEDYNYDWTPNEGDECPDGLSGIDCNSSKVVGLNYWKGCATSAFDGDIVEVACDGPAQQRDLNNPKDTNTSGVITVPESGTYYFVIKGGWWGATGETYQINIDYTLLAPIL